MRTELKKLVIEDRQEEIREKRRAAARLGGLGRARRLTAEERSIQASNAARARWIRERVDDPDGGKRNTLRERVEELERENGFLVNRLDEMDRWRVEVLEMQRLWEVLYLRKNH